MEILDNLLVDIQCNEGLSPSTLSVCPGIWNNQLANNYTQFFLSQACRIQSITICGLKESGFWIQRNDHFAAACKFLVVACATSVSVGFEVSVFCLCNFFRYFIGLPSGFVRPKNMGNTKLAT